MTGLSIKALITHCDIQICARAAADPDRAVYVYLKHLLSILYHYFCVTDIQIITEVLEYTFIVRIYTLLSTEAIKIE